MWAVDSFAAVVRRNDPPTFAKDLPQTEWEGVLSGIGIAGTPWLEGVRSDWFSARLRVVTRRDPSVVASARDPALTGEQIGRAVAIYDALPGTAPPPGPGQDDLQALLAAHHP
jgi:hypothetical protein